MNTHIRMPFKILLGIAVALLCLSIIFHRELIYPNEMSDTQYKVIVYMYKYQCPVAIPFASDIMNAQGYLREQDYEPLINLCDYFSGDRSKKKL